MKIQDKDWCNKLVSKILISKDANEDTDMMFAFNQTSRSITGHKVVLGAASKHLKNYFRQNPHETTIPTNYKFKTMEAVIGLIYSGKLDVVMSVTLNVARAATGIVVTDLMNFVVLTPR
jgi:hypothetical protein